MYRSLHLLIAVGGLVCAYGLTRSNAGPIEPLDDYNVPGFVAVLPNEIKWLLDPQAPGAASAILLGNPDKPGPFVVRVRLPAGTKVMPHTHPVDRTYCVLAGEWKLGFGRTYDAATLHTFPAGSIYRLPAMVPHYQATGTPETIIEIHAIGPSTTDFINPQDDPRRQR
jgi:quercetin dioxygenase-like cupin family protein